MLSNTLELLAALVAVGRSARERQRSGAVELGDPMRGELLGIERLEQLAVASAREHVVTTSRQVIRARDGNDLLERLAFNRRQLLAAYRSAVQAVLEDR